MVAAAFADSFGSSPDLIVAAPGRVNLVGEHTDYSHLPVLPIAIERRLLIAIANHDEGIQAISQMHDGVVEVGTDESPVWGRYLAGAISMLGESAAGRGARLVIGGDLPSTGGLSSSSALTVGLLWAFNLTWGLGIDKLEVVELAISAERQVGVESGGMDQTVIAFAREGNALRIDFAPAKQTQVPVPGTIGFVAGYSGTAAPKGTTARDGYNRAVVSCRAAAAMLTRIMGREPSGGERLGDVVGATPEEIQVLPRETSAVEVAKLAGVGLDRLVALTAGRFDPGERLRPQAAARHVLSEAARVDEAVEWLTAGDGEALGSVFDSSHASLVDYGVSTPELDRLTMAARDAGAWGARLTGAGFGGWAVAACDPSIEANVVEAMTATTGGPAFPVRPSAGMSDWEP